MNVGMNRGKSPYRNCMESQIRVIKKKKNQENGCGILTPEPETTEELKAHQWEQLEGNNHTT